MWRAICSYVISIEFSSASLPPFRARETREKRARGDLKLGNRSEPAAVLFEVLVICGTILHSWCETPSSLSVSFFPAVCTTVKSTGGQQEINPRAGITESFTASQRAQPVAMVRQKIPYYLVAISVASRGAPEIRNFRQTHVKRRCRRRKLQNNNVRTGINSRNE